MKERIKLEVVVTLEYPVTMKYWGRKEAINNAKKAVLSTSIAAVSSAKPIKAKLIKCS